MYFTVKSRADTVLTVANLSSTILSSSQLNAVFALFSASAKMDNQGGYTIDLNAFLLYLISQTFEVDINDVTVCANEMPIL